MDPLQYIRVLAEDNSKAKNIYSRSVTLAEELGRVGGAKRNSVSQRQIPYDFTHVWNLRSKTNEESGKEKEREREWARGRDRRRRRRERISSWLPAEHGAWQGSPSMTMGSLPKLKSRVRHLTNWTTMVPLEIILQWETLLQVLEGQGIRLCLNNNVSAYDRFVP